MSKTLIIKIVSENDTVRNKIRNMLADPQFDAYIEEFSAGNLNQRKAELPIADLWIVCLDGLSGESRQALAKRFNSDDTLPAVFALDSSRMDQDTYHDTVKSLGIEERTFDPFQNMDALTNLLRLLQKGDKWTQAQRKIAGDPKQQPSTDRSLDNRDVRLDFAPYGYATPYDMYEPGDAPDGYRDDDRKRDIGVSSHDRSFSDSRDDSRDSGPTDSGSSDSGSGSSD